MSDDTPHLRGRLRVASDYLDEAALASSASVQERLAREALWELREWGDENGVELPDEPDPAARPDPIRTDAVGWLALEYVRQYGLAPHFAAVMERELTHSEFDELTSRRFDPTTDPEHLDLARYVRTEWNRSIDERWESDEASVNEERGD